VDGDEAQDDPFGVQLEWPDEQLGEPFEASSRDDAADAAPAPAPAPASPPAPAEPTPFRAPAPEPTLATPIVERPPGELAAALGEEDVAVVLARVLARVDALTSATTTFRNVVSDRVSEYTERVVQVASGTAADLEEQRRLAQRDMTEVRTGVANAHAAIDRLARSVDALAAEVERISTDLGGQLDRVVDEVQTMRRRTAVRSAARDADGGEAPARRPTRKR
jgi:hypothetical protein